MNCEHKEGFGSVDWPIGWGWYINPGWRCLVCGYIRLSWPRLHRSVLWWENTKLLRRHGYKSTDRDQLPRLRELERKNDKLG